MSAYQNWNGGQDPILGVTITQPDYFFPNSTFVFDGPINTKLVVLPMSPDMMNVQFLLFTCKNRNVSQNFTYLSPSSAWSNSNLNVSQNTRIIIHGWNGKYPLEWSMVSDYFQTNYYQLKFTNDI